MVTELKIEQRTSANLIRPLALSFPQAGQAMTASTVRSGRPVKRGLGAGSYFTVPDIPLNKSRIPPNELKRLLASYGKYTVLLSWPDIISFNVSI